MSRSGRLYRKQVFGRAVQLLEKWSDDLRFLHSPVRWFCKFEQFPFCQGSPVSELNAVIHGQH